jgi:hypothetical protein
VRFLVAYYVCLAAVLHSAVCFVSHHMCIVFLRGS